MEQRLARLALLHGDRAAPGKPPQHHRRYGEGHAVDRHHALGSTTSRAPAATRARGESEVGDRAVQRGRAAGARGHQARQAGQRGGLNSALPTPASSANATCDERIDERDPEERDRAHDVGDDRAQLARPAIRGGAEDRPEQHRREEIGQQHEADRPRRAEALVGDQQERYVARRPCRATTGRGPRRTNEPAARAAAAGELPARREPNRCGGRR